jgi:hypothetical protein
MLICTLLMSVTVGFVAQPALKSVIIQIIQVIIKITRDTLDFRDGFLVSPMIRRSSVCCDLPFQRLQLEWIQRNSLQPSEAGRTDQGLIEFD